MEVLFRFRMNGRDTLYHEKGLSVVKGFFSLCDILAHTTKNITEMLISD